MKKILINSYIYSIIIYESETWIISKIESCGNVVLDGTNKLNGKKTKMKKCLILLEKSLIEIIKRRRWKTIGYTI